MPVSSYIKDDNMAMNFFEVFGGIRLDERLNALMEDTTIEKLTTDSQRTLLRVYLSSPRLIDRQDICKVQEAIRKQKMADCGMEVKVYERFHLPTHFTAEKVYSSYEDSIVFSINIYNADVIQSCLDRHIETHQFNESKKHS